jgi:hypothetical protein
MYNIFHRLSSRELEDAVIQYLSTNQQRHDLVTMMINNNCSFSITRDGELICQTQKSPPESSEKEESK